MGRGRALTALWTRCFCHNPLSTLIELLPGSLLNPGLVRSSCQAPMSAFSALVLPSFELIL